MLTGIILISRVQLAISYKIKYSLTSWSSNYSLTFNQIKESNYTWLFKNFYSTKVSLRRSMIHYSIPEWWYPSKKIIIVDKRKWGISKEREAVQRKEKNFKYILLIIRSEFERLYIVWFWLTGVKAMETIKRAVLARNSRRGSAVTRQMVVSKDFHGDKTLPHDTVLWQRCVYVFVNPKVNYKLWLPMLMLW